MAVTEDKIQKLVAWETSNGDFVAWEDALRLLEDVGFTGDILRTVVAMTGVGIYLEAEDVKELLRAKCDLPSPWERSA